MSDAFMPIRALLAQERAAILSGEFDTIDALAPKKADLMTALVGHADITKLRELEITVRHNQSLLQAAIEGVKVARKRLADIQDAQDRLSVYSPQGVQTIKKTTGLELSKRA